MIKMLNLNDHLAPRAPVAVQRLIGTSYCVAVVCFITVRAALKRFLRGLSILHRGMSILLLRVPCQAPTFGLGSGPNHKPPRKNSLGQLSNDPDAA